MLRLSPLWGFFCFLSLVCFCIQASASDDVQRYSGGANTYLGPQNKNAFTHHSPKFPRSKRLDYRIGESVFQKLWVQSPSSTTASDGLGPRFNARACHQCHVRNGRGRVSEKPVSGQLNSMIFKLSQQTTNGQFVPDPRYGRQLQPNAVPALKPEGNVWMSWRTSKVTLNGGEVATLRKPVISLHDLSQGPLHKNTRGSVRMAMPMIGLGLLEAIPDERLEALASPERQQRLGLRGHVNRVWDVRAQAKRIGRFGWKASAPSIMQQNAIAFSNDMGLSTTIFPKGAGDCQPMQKKCLALPNGNSKHLDNVEVPDSMMDVLLVFTRHLAVPNARNRNDADVLRGQEVFSKVGCASCHVPSHTTGASSSKVLAHQTIWPYTDMLLHDMGPDLDDGMPESEAKSSEWRTSPLWSVGLSLKVDGDMALLHDGRARSIQEAILWHGGEAQRASDAYTALTPKERQQLVKFVESL